MLKVKPILTISDGLVDSASKARGLKKAFAEVGHLIHHSDQTLNGKRIIIGHTNAKENLAHAWGTGASKGRVAEKKRAELRERAGEAPRRTPRQAR